MFDKNFFGANLKKIRKFHNLTIVNLCAPLGVNKGTISNLENGVKSPSLDMLIELAEYFNVSIDYLIGRSDDPQFEYYLQKTETILLLDMPEDFISIYKYAKSKGLSQQSISVQERFQLIKWFESWKQKFCDSDQKTSEDWQDNERLQERFRNLRDSAVDFPDIEVPSVSMPNQLADYLLSILDADIKQSI